VTFWYFLDVRSVDLYQDVEEQLNQFVMNLAFSQKLALYCATLEASTSGYQLLGVGISFIG
jgi:hypothetical protein